MSKSVVIFGCALAVLGGGAHRVVAAAVPGSAGASATSGERAAPMPTDYYMGVGLITSRTARPTDYRLYKSTFSDEAGSGSESSMMLPNLNYMMAVGSYRLGERTRLAAVGLQSLDRLERRKMSTPFGREFVIPGRILGLKYQYLIVPSLALQVDSMNIEGLGFLDPALSVRYGLRGSNGWLGRMSAGVTIPVSRLSQAAGLLTRAQLKGIAMYQPGASVIGGYASVSHSFPTYREEGGGKSPRSGSIGAIGPAGSIRPEEVDLILMERETSRTAVTIGTHATLVPNVRYSASLGASYIRTAGERTIWLSNFRPLSLSYSRPSWEVSADLSLLSDIREFRAPTFPRIVNLGLRLSWKFGTPPPRI